MFTFVKNIIENLSQETRFLKILVEKEQYCKNSIEILNNHLDELRSLNNRYDKRLSNYIEQEEKNFLERKKQYIQFIERLLQIEDLINNSTFNSRLIRVFQKESFIDPYIKEIKQLELSLKKLNDGFLKRGLLLSEEHERGDSSVHSDFLKKEMELRINNIEEFLNLFKYDVPSNCSASSVATSSNGYRTKVPNILSSLSSLAIDPIKGKSKALWSSFPFHQIKPSFPVPIPAMPAMPSMPSMPSMPAMPAMPSISSIGTDCFKKIMGNKPYAIALQSLLSSTSQKKELTSKKESPSDTDIQEDDSLPNEEVTRSTEEVTRPNEEVTRLTSGAITQEYFSLTNEEATAESSTINSPHTIPEYSTKITFPFARAFPAKLCPLDLRLEKKGEVISLLKACEVKKATELFERNFDNVKVSKKNGEACQLGSIQPRANNGEQYPRFSVIKIFNKNNPDQLYALYRGKEQHKLGEGAYGMVKLACCINGPNKGKWVAIKIQEFPCNSLIAYLLTHEENMLKRFNQYLGSQIRENVPSRKDKSKIVDKYYTACLLAEGQTLESYILKNKNIIAQITALIAVFKELHLLHYNQKTLHGDLNFNNIMYDDNLGKVVFTDWFFAATLNEYGLAQSSDVFKNYTFSSQRVNQYHPPECYPGGERYAGCNQRQPRAICAASEIYVLGYWIRHCFKEKFKDIVTQMLKHKIPDRPSINKCIYYFEHKLIQEQELIGRESLEAAENEGRKLLQTTQNNEKRAKLLKLKI